MDFENSDHNKSLKQRTFAPGTPSSRPQNRRRPWAAREKAGILIMRDHGARIQHIAALTGRSTSVIHRVLKRAEKYGHNLDAWRRRLDMRKIPYKTRMRACFIAWDKLLRVWKQLEAFILGKGEKPP